MVDIIRRKKYNIIVNAIAALKEVLGRLLCLRHFVERCRRPSQGIDLNLLGGADAEVSVVHTVRRDIGEPLTGCPEGEAVL